MRRSPSSGDRILTARPWPRLRTQAVPHADIRVDVGVRHGLVELGHGCAVER